MNRRVAIKKASLLLGMAVGSPAVMSILNGCVPKKTIDWKPVFFTLDQAALLTDITDIILPRTNTPGALDVGVDAFIDFIVHDCYSDEGQQHFVEGLTELDKASNSLYGKIFIKLSSLKKKELLTGLDAKAEKNKIDLDNGIKPFYSQIKELTLLGYFTSEEIITNHLEYVPIPTRLEGCTPVNTNQKIIVGNQI